MDDQIIQSETTVTNENKRDPQKAHNGEKVSLVSFSPNGEYIVTYSRDDSSIEGWIVKGFQLILDPQTSTYKLSITNRNIIINNITLPNYLAELKKREIKLNPPLNKYCSSIECPQIYFKKDGSLVISNYRRILVYSPYDKDNNELTIKLCYDLADGGRECVDENFNIWDAFPNHIFCWNSNTFQLESSYSFGFMENYKLGFFEKFTVTSKGNLIVVKYGKKITIFLRGIHFPIQNIQIEGSNIKVELCEAQNNVYLLAFNLPACEDEKQNVILYHTTKVDKHPVDISEIFNNDNFILHKYNSESKEAFGLVNGEIIYKNLSDKDFHDFFEGHQNDDNVFIGWNTYLCEKNYCNDTLAFPDMDNIGSLLSNGYENNRNIIDFKNQRYKWIINLEDAQLSVYTDEGPLCSKYIKYIREAELKWKLLNNNALALALTSTSLDYKSIIIYEYDINNINNKSIKTKYFFYEYEEGKFNESRLPIMDTTELMKLEKKLYESRFQEGNVFKQILDNLSESIDSIIEDDRCFATYGSTLLPILIDSPNPVLTHHIEIIWNKCTKLVKENPKGNLKFLNIITSSMNDLYKKYPDYITKFNSEMFMILDPSNEQILENEDNYPHFDTFSQEIGIRKTKLSKKIFLIHFIHEKLIIPLYIYTYIYVLPLVEPLHEKYIEPLIEPLYKKHKEHKEYKEYYVQRKQQIVLIVPYLGFSHYPSEYSWWKEIFFPQSSVFVDTCKKEFYNNWNGEAIINFKWKTFGRIYYFIIWLLFMVFLICFTIASYPTYSITREARIKLYQTSISFGFFHIIFELRQFIWNPKNYFLSIWNYFVVLAIIIASFAYAFFLLLHPQNLLDSLNAQNPNDPNNPWALSNTYNQVDENGNILNKTLIQVPSESTNLFYSYPTSILAIYLFLTGNQNALSPWAPNSTVENTILFILMSIFSFLVVIYLMNLFIGLLNMVIDKDNDRASYLAQKAEIIAEIELFCLFPNQRRWNSWFPEVIYYRVNVEKARVYIREAIKKGEWKTEDWPEMKYKILKLLRINDVIIEQAV
ncbi:hypothetical protein RclHR1_01890001 [Rhizophagus clarus]|uniref:Ion transport domain-containing protein n=1 Tax=Rhizophagus clarus TaxID=94130 RepID=A0A2Z6QN46_9GLOM|nr:hypothetical protein RclHR1_01890001 [Rhizophagus clarus]